MINQAALDKLYSLKQQEVLKWHFTHEYFILINHGAVRTGKTILNNDIFISELHRIGKFAKQHGIIDPQYIIAGASIGAIERNILNPLRQKYGIKIRPNSFNAFRLFGTLVTCFGHDDIGKVAAITGMTAYGAYVNEVTKAKDEVLKQIIKRCSGEQGFRTRIIMDTNPDSPEHPVKKDYIDKSGELDKKGNIIIKDFHWVLADNTFLSDEYVANIKATTPSGVFTQRDINGGWCTADGMVYLDFDEKDHIVDNLPPKEKFEYYFCGVDWGYEHKGAIGLFGVCDGVKYLIKEISEKHRLIDWWTEQALKIIDEYGFGIPFYCDDARPDNIKTFKNAGIWAVGANKSIAAGVECVAKHFKTRTLKLFSGGLQKDNGFKKEIFQYVWDEKTGLPLKTNDDVMDMMRYAIFTDSKIRRI